MILSIKYNTRSHTRSTDALTHTTHIHTDTHTHTNIHTHKLTHTHTDIPV